jgi:excisionase family DNA binding protein
MFNMENLTASEAAKRFEVSIQTIYRHIKSGKLKGWQKDGKWYVQIEESDEPSVQRFEHDFEPGVEQVEQNVDHPQVELLLSEIKHLREVLARRDHQNDSLTQQIDHLTQVVAMGQKNVATLTDQLETSRLMVEDLRQKKPLWKRIFRRK